MPFGRYTVFRDGGEPVGTEEFRAAPGPMGWRYFSEVETKEPSYHQETLDLAVHADWRIANVRIGGAHELLLQASAGATVLTGYRGGERIEIPFGTEVHLDYLTPATNAITDGRGRGRCTDDPKARGCYPPASIRVEPDLGDLHLVRGRPRKTQLQLVSVKRQGPREVFVIYSVT